MATIQELDAEIEKRERITQIDRLIEQKQSLGGAANVAIGGSLGVPSGGGVSSEQVQPVEERGFLGSVSDFFTGEDRATRATQLLPELQGLFFGEDEAAIAKTTAGLLTATNPQEMAKIIQANHPNIGIQSDEKGNLIGGNNKTGAKAVLNKPGLSPIDFIQGAGLAAAFTPAGRVAGGAVRVGAAAGATSAGIEGLQALVGGEFNIEQVALDAVTAGVLDKAFEVAKATGKKIQDVLREQGINPATILEKVKGGAPVDKFERVGEKFKSPLAQRTQKSVGEELEKARQLDLTPEAQARIQRAEPTTQLTRAQATQDFAASEAEQTLLKLPTPEGKAAREFVEGQQRDLQEAATKFTDKFGGSARLTEARGETAAVTAREKGGQIQESLRQIKEKTRQEVSDLYTLAGETAGKELPLNNPSLVNIADDAIINLPITDATEKTMNTALAKFGLVGDRVEKSSRNKTNVFDGDQKIVITGDVTPLNLANAEQFRQALNKAVSDDRTGAAKGVINELDTQIDNIIKQGAESGRTGAFKAAREAFAKQKETFSAKDVVQNLTDFKKGTKTDFVDPEAVITKIAKGDKAVTNIRKIKQILLENPTPQSKKAWKSIQAETIGDIFSQAINKDTLEISGLRLNSAMKKFKPEALSELLGKKRFAELKRLQQTIGDVTIPPPGTTNPSGTFTKLLAMSERLGNFAGAGQINFGSLAVGVAQKGKELAGRKKTLEGIINTKTQALKKANPKMSKKLLERAAKTLAFLEIRELDKENK